MKKKSSCFLQKLFLSFADELEKNRLIFWNNISEQNNELKVLQTQKEKKKKVSKEKENKEIYIIVIYKL